MTTGDLRQDWENRDILQRRLLLYTFQEGQGRLDIERRLETGGDVVTGVRPLKLVSEENIYSRRCGATSLKI